MIDISKLTEKDLCFMFDHTNLKAFATTADITRLCEEAKEYGFRMVAINPLHTRLASLILDPEGQQRACRSLHQLPSGAEYHRGEGHRGPYGDLPGRG